ncbi:Cro/CI family transcriptional regulator [Staphylococcus piscifermentans]|uniref:DNA-binding protein n=1 Tax=Staphylococcus piscifermentans TaxID=70258 RepID=A0A239TGI0_9STAP|nr:XRE family transcriptional regulator [Staphylococcus piscifermentans]RTX85361.1 XRE family transcriptional regulator [Staphylococcus piscifermentans]GEP85539.1 DNA-binding protein [Staphylococcus piscifermentans]SNU96831.1 Cro/CI family transcriptional regulator [Staphylococcus piscifermentans]
MKEIGYKIKEYRINQHQTLKQLSEITGLSTSFLSQVERGESSIAITSLSKIADALKVDITSFFLPNKQKDFHIIPSDIKQFKINHSNQEFKRVSSEFENRKLENFIITIQPNDRSELSMHEGEELYYVIQGELTFFIENQKYVVKKGELIHYPSKHKHYYVNETDFPVTVLSVVTPKLF